MFARARWIRIAPAALALALCLPVQGCFGKFALTTKIWEFNRDISESYVVQEILFLAFLIIPVYAVGGVVDAFILHPIELITGSNPIAMGTPGEARTVPLEDGSALTVRWSRTGVEFERTLAGRTARWTLRDTGHGMELRDDQGRIVAETVRLEDGSFQVIDPSGQVLAHPGRALLADLAETGWRQGARAMVARAGAAWTTAECQVALAP